MHIFRRYINELEKTETDKIILHYVIHPQDTCETEDILSIKTFILI